MKEKDILKIIQGDLKAAETARENQDGLIEKRKAEYNGEPYGNEQDGKSKIVSRDIKKQDEWMHASLKDPFVASSDIIKANPVTFEDRDAARQNELVLNTQFCRQFNRFSFMTKLIKTLTVEGTAVIQTGWEYEEEEKEVEYPVTRLDPFTMQEVLVGYEKVYEMVPTVNRPTAEVRRNEDVYIDPTCQDDIDKAQFIIVRYESDMSTLRQDGRYKNLDKVKMSSTDKDANPITDDDYEPEDETYFEFDDEPRRKLVVYEYWGNIDIDDDGIAEPIMMSWIGNTIIRMEENPFPDGKLPFIVVPFSSVPFTIYGESNADLISDNQKIKTAMIRGIIDNMAQANNGQQGIPKQALDPVNLQRFLSGKNFEYNPNVDPNGFFRSTFTQIPPSAYETIALQNNEIESLTGQKSFSQGITGNSLGATATGAKGVLDATATRRLNLVRNIAENAIKPLMRKWMVYNAEFLEPSQVMRITNDEFIEIKRDDLSGQIDIDIQVSTSEDNANKAQELAFMMQTMSQSMDQGMRNLLMGEIARLYKMPDLAEKIENYQPQPDPVMQQIQQLELAKLQAEVFNEQAKGQENAVDVGLKRAKTATEIAKAKELNENADLKALDFVQKESGVDHLKDLEKQQQKINGENMKVRLANARQRSQ